MLIVVFIIVLWFILWSSAVFVLAAPSHRHYDKTVGEFFSSDSDDIDANNKFLKDFHQAHKNAFNTRSLKQGLSLAREFADNLSSDHISESEFISTTNTVFNAEWTIAPNVSTSRRVLFFHGGAFAVGSARGHRKFTDRLSQLCNAAVLSVNYRMLPEHSRKSGIYDARKAYHWIINNGPFEQSACDLLVLAGDSAGGNLALMLSSWSRKNSVRRPDAVIGFSPSLDSTLSSPTIKKNQKTDKILGGSVGKLSYLPRPILLWATLLILRMNPSNPCVSPLFYHLKDLPPTLIQASSSEMLLGEAIRYTNKAISAGSTVKLQIWQDQIHDWHLFSMDTGSANQAWDEVQKFISTI